MRAIDPRPLIATLLTAVLALGLTISAAQAAEREKIEAFLEVTGFDVALESIRLGADNAPAMLGVEAEDFGAQWKSLVAEVFDTELMHGFALDILEPTLSEDLLTHAADFYASDLGQRLVLVENASHMKEDDDAKREAGEAIIAGLESIDSPRLALLRRLNDASGSEDATIRAIQEVQVRFLMAAASAGVIELRMEESDLREALRSDEPQMRTRIRASALSNAAYTYQAFSDAEVTSYAEALEHPKMKEVYALLNAVQFEITANRYEEVAARLAGLQPSQDL
ncbi:MAG: DUF2059 domain-containing protein [Pseudomonadota bacterium]